MGAAMVSLFNELQSEATAPARIIATVVLILVGITLTMMPWEHGAVAFGKNALLRIAIGLAIVINAPAIIAAIAP